MSKRNVICLPQVVDVPMPLYKSMQGKYFVGYADNLEFSGPGISAWSSLYNPPGSNVCLHVNVWTATSLFDVFRVQIWFNAELPGTPLLSADVTTSNYCIEPTPEPRVRLLSASNVMGEPKGGVKAFVRRGDAQSTIVSEEDGKFIFPPGGSFTVFLSHPEMPDAEAAGRVAFGWWEQPIECSTEICAR